MKRIIFTVTNDLTCDQRMIRICSSLALNGYDVLLVGRKTPGSLPLPPAVFKQERMACLFPKGFLFYTEFNIRLFFVLLFRKTDIICAIDLDTILPCLVVSRLKKTRRVYDAHELFCEMKEVVSRPFIHRCWKWIEKRSVPHFSDGYTVNDAIAGEFNKIYGVKYTVIRNLPLLSAVSIPEKKEKYVIYQGSVNEGRCFETFIPAMKHVDARLIICGDGNFIAQAKKICADEKLNDKVTFTGKLTPEALKLYTVNAYIGIALVENAGLNNYYSLANRFFDYMHAGIPQVCVDFPAYREIVDQYPFALLIGDTTIETISAALNRLLQDKNLYHELQQQCLRARELLNWQAEEKRLLSFYQQLGNRD